jgi:thiamine pyrophosphokinase
MRNNLPKPLHTVEFVECVTLLGHADMTPRQLKGLIDSNRPLVCADGGAYTAMENGLTPDIVIGDMDSFVDRDNYVGRIICITEQDSTDFEKCLYTVKAPIFIGYGFLGGRIDHELATLSTLVRYPDKPVILVGEEDICFCCPQDVSIEAPIGTRVSIYPMSTTKMRSLGLKWPLDGLELSPVKRVATSNVASDATFLLHIEQGHALVVLPVEQIMAVKNALAGRKIHS